jgi:hypothetical protein
MRRLAAFAVLVLLAFALPAVPASGSPPGKDRVTERGYDADGRLLWERGVRTDDDAIAFERSYHYAAKAAPGGTGEASSALTDCASPKYVKAGWSWAAPFSAYASSDADLFDAAGRAWDNATGAGIFAGFAAGRLGSAGTRDGVNQVEFVSLGASSTIAVTTTWYNRLSHRAVESDGQYNTYYPWSRDGAAGAMDVLDIATHEVGHTFGLDHPKGSGGISCLTMYAYANLGETQKRTLGDGDVLGIRAVYGA